MQTPDHKLGLALLAAVVIVAGCTDSSQNNSVTVSQTSGVEIMSFSASPSSISGGQPATLQMNIKNRGGVNAENVQARLTNPEFGSDSGLWSVEGGAWKDGFQTLRGPNPDSGQDALTRTLQWSVTAPNRDNQIDIDYDFDADLFYSYNTQASTQMRLVNTNAVEDRPTRSTPSIENTGGPIQLGLQASSPVLFTESSGGSSQSLPFCITMQNQGAGTPFLYEDSMVDGNAYRGVNDDITNMINLSVETSSSFLEFEDNNLQKELIGNPPSTCVDMNASYVSTSEGSTTAQITINADYGYRVQDSTAITLTTGP
jgi:hypothetical protein